MPSERETRKLLIDPRLQADGRLGVEEAGEGDRGRETPFGPAPWRAPVPPPLSLCSRDLRGRTAKDRQVTPISGT